jgi:hypothetical protein
MRLRGGGFLGMLHKSAALSRADSGYRRVAPTCDAA